MRMVLAAPAAVCSKGGCLASPSHASRLPKSQPGAAFPPRRLLSLFCPAGLWHAVLQACSWWLAPPWPTPRRCSSLPSAGKQMHEHWLLGAMHALLSHVGALQREVLSQLAVAAGFVADVCSLSTPFPGRSDNPIIFFEHVLLYNVKGEPVLAATTAPATLGCWDAAGWAATGPPARHAAAEPAAGPAAPTAMQPPSCAC